MSHKSALAPWVLVLGTLVAHAADTPPIHHRVHIDGTGARTIVFESGLGDTSDIWQNIQPSVATHCAKTFSYNRAGYLDSDPAAGTRDAASIVAELRDELRRQHLLPPYVLVGHSLGGLYLQYFARNFPDEVQGLVLIDSTHWQEAMTIDATANTPYRANTAVTLFMPLIMRQELADSSAAGRQVDESPPATKLPTLVLSSTRVGAKETAEQRAHAVALQDEIAAAFPGSRHVFVADSGHYIQRDQPGAVVDAIRDLAGCEHHGAESSGH